MRRKFTFDEKINVLTLLFSGASKASLARMMKIDRRDISMWELRFHNYGIHGLKRLHRVNFPEEFKQEVLASYQQGGISMRQLAADYNICYYTLRNWLREERTNER